LEKVRNLAASAPASVATEATFHTYAATIPSISASNAVPIPDGIKLQGILWGTPPAAIINGQLVHANDRFKLKVWRTEVNFHCLEIRKNSVRIENMNTGEQGELPL
jgi:hypothetical protein